MGMGKSSYNGNQFVGWGQEPYLSEFANAGNTEEDTSLNFLVGYCFIYTD